jgi:D-glycero-D-manno-heptose 1,7-bisphosphate phosphatase
MSRRAAFLDRDGTLNVRPPDHRYVTSEAEFSWLPGAARGAARLAAAGYVLAVASNQRGISLGVLDPAVLRAIEARIQRDLAGHGCAIEAFDYCPHETAAGCNCRKPRPGMFLRLAEGLDIDLRRSWVIGDSESDVIAGQSVGCRTALVGTVPDTCEPDLVAPSLEAASDLVVREDRRVSRRPRRQLPRTPRRARGK